MDRRLEILKLAEVECQSAMNKIAFDANYYLEQCSPESLNLFMKCIEQYSISLNNFNVIQKMKAQLIAQNSPKEEIGEIENEN